jgi:hypothetical protein
MVAYQYMESNQTHHIKIILVDLIFNVLLHHCVVNFKHIIIATSFIGFTDHFKLLIHGQSDHKPVYIREIRGV